MRDKLALVDEYINTTLSSYYKASSLHLEKLIDSIEYSVKGGGKRLRPLLVLGASEYLSIPLQKVLPAACSIEFIHTYSLIHDDLPAIDNDDVRRGRPSSHKKFDEATAILTGDTLLTEAFFELTKLAANFEPKNVLNAIQLVARNIGLHGMVGGQFLDINISPNKCTIPQIELIHVRKTGALIVASILLPAELIGAPDAIKEKLKKYGEACGLAFQIADDLIDYEKKEGLNRPNYASFISSDEMREKVSSLIDSAISAIGKTQESEFLVSIAEFINNYHHHNTSYETNR